MESHSEQLVDGTEGRFARGDGHAHTPNALKAIHMVFVDRAAHIKVQAVRQ